MHSIYQDVAVIVMMILIITSRIGNYSVLLIRITNYNILSKLLALRVLDRFTRSRILYAYTILVVMMLISLEKGRCIITF